MSKGRFLNQKLGKRMTRKAQLLKARLGTQRPAKLRGSEGPGAAAGRPSR
jgi:hypothetical protein